MANTDGNDTLMFLETDGLPIMAECNSSPVNLVLDPLAQGFLPFCYFELRSFKFGVKLKDNTPPPPVSHKDVEENNRKIADAMAAFHADPSSAGGAHLKLASRAQFTKFTSGGQPNTYPVSLNEISFERTIDKASMVIWNKLVAKKKFDKGVIIRRKNTGLSLTPMLTFARFEFSDLLVTDIDMGNDEFVTEECKMICRQVAFTYSIQLNEGITVPTTTATWGYNMQDSSAL